MSPTRIQVIITVNGNNTADESATVVSYCSKAGHLWVSILPCVCSSILACAKTWFARD